MVSPDSIKANTCLFEQHLDFADHPTYLDLPKPIPGFLAAAAYASG